MAQKIIAFFKKNSREIMKQNIRESFTVFSDAEHDFIW